MKRPGPRVPTVAVRASIGLPMLGVHQPNGVDVLEYTKTAGGDGFQAESMLPGWAVVLHTLVDRQVGVESEQHRQAVQLREVIARVEALEGAHDEYTARGYVKLKGVSLGRGDLARLGAAASRAVRRRGYLPRKRQATTFDTVNVYPVWALAEGLAAISDPVGRSGGAHRTY